MEDVKRTLDEAKELFNTLAGVIDHKNDIIEGLRQELADAQSHIKDLNEEIKDLSEQLRDAYNSRG